MISVIIVTHNRINSLRNCVESILQQNKFEPEIIVIDNASKDKTSGILENEYKNRLKLIKNNIKRSLGYCKSLGLRYSAGEIVVFTDDDCIVCADWLSRILRSFDSSDCDIVAGSVESLNKINFPWWWQDSLNWTIGISNMDDPNFMPLGCNVAFRRGVLKDIDSQNENHPKSPSSVYTEDTLRIKTAIKKGYKIKLDKLMLVYHQINPLKLSFKHIIYRSWLEGEHWVENEKDLKILALRIIILLVNPLRFVITLKIHYFLRSIVSLAYITNYFKQNVCY